ncbi:LuxR C-terminal-related transcriptional regulator [Catenulispora subtropica]|uniref:HTH luxR-type domain-containing protein n=1 Tax=Catenulispora subtropica TaxID=450798 RepID=A0ABN2QL30_9ACTN
MGQDGGIGLPTPVSELVDRESEIDEVRSLLRTSRLITLTGPGGIGKTRLAIAAAAAALGADGAPHHEPDPALADGAVFVPLAELAAGVDVARAVAAALDLSGLEGVGDGTADAEKHLVEVLRRRALILVLDNCEHRLEAVAGLALRLLTDCRRLTVLATSREPLGVPGETVWTVPPLSHPPTIGRARDDRADRSGRADDRGGAPAQDGLGELGDSLIGINPLAVSPLDSLSGLGPVNGPDAAESAPVVDAEWASQFGAVRLFALRAKQAAGGFRLTDANARTVASICRRLDGIPLALELAAARVRALSVEEIEARLSDRFALLSGPFRFAETRHRTLRTSVEWSHQLLTAEEQELFAGLSVFSGGWTLHAAKGAIGPHAVDALTRLVDKSLVTVEPTPDGQRYSMLETLRAYAADELERAGRTAEMRERHAAYFLKLAERLNPRFYGPGQAQAFHLLDVEINNIRTAGRWFLADPGLAAEGLRLAAALWDFYCCRCHLGEGVRFARGALAHADRAGLTEPSVTRARVVLGLGALLELQGKGFEAMHALREAVRLAQLCDDPVTESYALRILAVNTLMIGDPEGDTAELADRAQESARRSGSLWQQAFASHMPVLLHDGEPDPERVARSWRLTSGTGDRRLLAYLRVMMSFSELGGDRAQETISTLNAAYQDFQDVGDRYGRLLALSTRLLAHLRWDEDARVAAMLIGKCEAAYAGIGSGPLAVFAEQIAQAAAQVRARLGDEAYNAAVQTGAKLTWDRMARALSDEVRLGAECWEPDCPFGTDGAHATYSTYNAADSPAAGARAAPGSPGAPPAEPEAVEAPVAAPRAGHHHDDRPGPGHLDRTPHPDHVSGTTHSHSTSGAAHGSTAPPAILGTLTPREQEIAGHVALGRTNRRIAEDLVISERTVDTHVQRILAKLGVANRVQLATLLAGRKE